MPKPDEPLKWSGDEPALIPCRCLTGVCILVGGAHFFASHFKADFVLLTLIAMAFAPWMGHVFESFGKEGLKYRAQQGEVAAGPPQPGAGQPSVAPASGTPAVIVNRSVSPGSVSTNRFDPPFTTLPNEAKTVLATLWKYQRIHFPSTVTGVGRERWTFIQSDRSATYSDFLRGLGALGFSGLAALARNGQFALTDVGLEYCRVHSEEISAWPMTYDNFDN